MMLVLYKVKLISFKYVCIPANRISKALVGFDTEPVEVY